jgi:hypothetical protein
LQPIAIYIMLRRLDICMPLPKENTFPFPVINN